MTTGGPISLPTVIPAEAGIHGNGQHTFARDPLRTDSKHQTC